MPDERVSGDERRERALTAGYAALGPVHRSGGSMVHPDVFRRAVAAYEQELGLQALLQEECEKRGLPVSLSALLRHIENNHAATLGFKDLSIEILRDKLDAVLLTAEERAALVGAVRYADIHRSWGGVGVAAALKSARDKLDVREKYA
jgi:hypothetical protein